MMTPLQSLHFSAGKKPSHQTLRQQLMPYQAKMADLKKQRDAIASDPKYQVSFYKRQLAENALTQNMESRHNAMRLIAIGHRQRILSAAGRKKQPALTALAQKVDRLQEQYTQAIDPKVQSMLWNQIGDTLLAIIVQGRL